MFLKGVLTEHRKALISRGSLADLQAEELYTRGGGDLPLAILRP